MIFVYQRPKDKPLSLYGVQQQLIAFCTRYQQLPEKVLFPIEEYFLVTQLMAIEDFNKNLFNGIPIDISFVEQEGEAYI